jgi:hypothetical protein
LDYEKLEGELRKLGFDVGATTILTVLLRHSIPPALERGRQGSSWRTFLNHYKDQLIACDLFTVETLTLQTLYVLFFIEHGTRQVHFAGCTAHPDSALRHAVIWRRSSNGTPSYHGRRLVERILTVVETCRQQQRTKVIT